ncbi:MAG TPA: substrate-binding domain-containing protein [Paracoccaceae bacterium]|nr:substrate-binding domain-containing protein [Paracoccaceae bacterium]
MCAAALIVLLCPVGAGATETSDLVSEDRLRVCADPANMPFSSRAREGFENAIAELLAGELGRTVQYTWFPQATGFVRQTLTAGRCDVIIGYAQGDEFVLNTNHYYTSAYVILVPADGKLAGVDRLSDPLLADARIGLVAGSPPATHLARLGLADHVRPYPLMVDRRHEDPAGRMIADLAAGEIDAAILWGPIGGYHAMQAADMFELKPLLHEEGFPRLFYRITMGVRQGELRWKRELNSVLRRNKDRIDAILESYGVPLVDDYGAARVDR